MKKLTYVLLMIVLLSLCVGCGVKQNMEEKIAEKVIEQAVGDADIDIDGEEVTIKTEEGNVTFGSTEWPDTDLSSKIPEFKKGKIASVMNSEAYLLVIVEEVGENDFMNYYEEVKGEFNQESYESKNDDMIAYMGKNAGGISIMASYTLENYTVSISGSLPEEE